MWPFGAFFSHVDPEACAPATPYRPFASGLPPLRGLLLFRLFFLLLFLLLFFQFGEAFLGGLGLLRGAACASLDLGKAALEALGFGRQTPVHLLELLIPSILVLPVE